MDMRMPRDSVSCSLITQNYRVNGLVSVTAAGLVGVANDNNASFIELDDASLVRIHRPQEIVAQFNVYNMVKARVIAILCEKTADLGRISIARAGFQRQISYRVWGSVHGYEVFGIMECPGKFDFSAQIFQGGSQFGALFNATLIPVFFPQLVTRAPAILYNRQMVEGMGVISEVEESEAIESRKLGGTGPIPRGGTGQFPRGGPGSPSTGGTGQFPRGGPGSPSTGGTGQFPRGGPGSPPSGGTGPIQSG
jgi:hypothetical protein